MTTLPAFKPYISLDIETSGLDIVNCSILQIGAVYDDGVSPVEDLPSIGLYIKNYGVTFESGALALHGRTGFFDRLHQACQDKTAIRLTEALDRLLDFIQSHRPNYGRITIAGKNVASFDLPMIERAMTNSQTTRLHELIGPSFIDPGSIYYPSFGRIPSLDQILTHLKLDRTSVTHDAVEDCRDVIRTIRSSLLQSKQV